MDRPNGLKTLMILVACLVMLGVMQTEAHAVAGKTVTAMAGLALAEVTLEFELTDGTSVTAEVDQQGNVELPENVNQQTVKNCYRKKQTATGETNERIDCAGWLPAGSAAAASSSMTRNLLGGLFGNAEFIIGGGAVRALGGGNDGGSTFNVNSSSAPGQTVVGGSLNIQMRTLPVNFHGIKLGGFVEFDQFFSADSTTGFATNHPGPGLDTKTTRRIERAYAFGFTQVVPLGNGFSVDFLQGLAFVQQTIGGESNEAKGGGMLITARSSATHIVPKLGTSLEYQIPGSSISVRLASEFIYLPSLGANAFSTFTNSSYGFSTRGTWSANAMFGLVIPFTFLSGM